jgi:hypothetical protein
LRGGEVTVKSLVENSVPVLDGEGVLLEGFVRRSEASASPYNAISISALSQVHARTCA